MCADIQALDTACNGERERDRDRERERARMLQARYTEFQARWLRLHTMSSVSSALQWSSRATPCLHQYTFFNLSIHNLRALSKSACLHPRFGDEHTYLRIQTIHTRFFFGLVNRTSKQKKESFSIKKKRLSWTVCDDSRSKKLLESSKKKKPQSPPI